MTTFGQVGSVDENQYEWNIHYFKDEYLIDKIWEHSR